MISRIVLENWRSHRKTELEFGKGTNVIVGVMGAGKTSVTDAICFGLFGTFPSLNTRKITLEEVIMRKPLQADFAKVQLWFDYNEEEYFVERIIFSGNKTNQAKLFKKNKLIAGPSVSQVTEVLQREIEMDYNLFSRAVYSEQNELDSFLRLSPRERKEKFDELLGLDKYEIARANASKLQNRLKESIKDKKDFLEKQKAQYNENEEIELEKKKKSKLMELDKIEKEKEELKKKSKELESGMKEQEKKQKENSALSESVLRGKAKLEQMQKVLLEIKREIGKRNFEGIKNEISEIEKKLKIAGENVEKTEKEIELMEKSLNDLSAKSGSKKSKIDETKRQLLELKNAKSNCPVCKRELGDATKNEIEKEIEKEKELALKEILEIEKSCEKILKGKEELKKEKKAFASEIPVFEKRKIELKEILNYSEKLFEKEKKSEELAMEISKAEKNLKELDFDENKFFEKRKELIQANSSIESLKKSHLNCIEIIESVVENIKRIELEKKRIKELNLEIRESGFFVEKLGLFCNSLKETQAGLRSVMVENINEAMSSTIWQKIYPYNDFVSAKMDIEEGNYELKVLENNGNWVRVEGILSGGERTAAALCIRIAFSLVLTQNLGWLILDEPTHNLDSNAVRELSLMLKEHLPQLVEQVFVITHDKEMEKAVSSHLYVFERDKNQNGISTIKEK